MEITDFLDAIKIPYDKDKVDAITADQIGNYMRKTYIGLDIAHTVPEIVDQVLGKERPSNETNLKRILKDFDIKLDDKLLWKDGMLDKAGEVLKSKFDKLKEDATKDSDKKFTELTGEHEKLKGDYNLEMENHGKTKGELKESETKHSSYITNQSLNEKVRDAKKTVTFGEEINDLTQKGFWATISEKYEVELSTEEDSKDGLRITNKDDKKRVNDGKDNLTLSDIYEIEAKEAKILKVNNVNPKDKKVVKDEDKGGEGEDKNKRQVNPAAIKHAEELENQ